MKIYKTILKYFYYKCIILYYPLNNSIIFKHVYSEELKRIINFEERVSVLKQKPEQKSIHSPENGAAVRAALVKSPRRSAQKHTL